jgi:maltose-binding protein MalE
VLRINDDPEFPKVNPNWDVVKRALTSAVALPQTSAWGRVNSALNTAVARTLRGEASPREALAQAAQEGQQALDELRR